MFGWVKKAAKKVVKIVKEKIIDPIKDFVEDNAEDAGKTLKALILNIGSVFKHYAIGLWKHTTGDKKVGRKR